METMSGMPVSSNGERLLPVTMKRMGELVSRFEELTKTLGDRFQQVLVISDVSESVTECSMPAGSELGQALVNYCSRLEKSSASIQKTIDPCDL